MISLRAADRHPNPNKNKDKQTPLCLTSLSPALRAIYYERFTLERILTGATGQEASPESEVCVAIATGTVMALQRLAGAAVGCATTLGVARDEASRGRNL